MRLGLDSFFKARETESKEILFSPHSFCTKLFTWNLFFEMDVSLCSSDWPARHVDQAVLEITDILCLTRECWDYRCVPPYPT